MLLAPPNPFGCPYHMSYYINWSTLASSVSILCLCVSKFKNGHTLTLKSVFTHQKTILVSNESYGINFAPIKRYPQYCVLQLHVRRQSFSFLCSLSTLCLYVCPYVFCFFYLYVLLSIFLSVSEAVKKNQDIS